MTMILFWLIALGNFIVISGMENAESSSRAGHTTFSNHNWKRLRKMCWHDPKAIVTGHDMHRLFGAPRYKRAFGDPPVPVMTPEAQLQMQSFGMNPMNPQQMSVGAGIVNPNEYSVQDRPGMIYHHGLRRHLHTRYTGYLPTYSNMVYYFYDDYHDHMVSLMDDLQKKFSSTDPEREVKFFMVNVSHGHKADFEATFREAKSVLPYFSICKGGAQILDVSEEKVIRDFIDQALNHPVQPGVPPMPQQMAQQGMQGGMRGMPGGGQKGRQGGMDEGGMQGGQNGDEMDGPME